MNVANAIPVDRAVTKKKRKPTVLVKPRIPAVAPARHAVAARARDARVSKWGGPRRDRARERIDDPKTHSI